MLEDMNIDSYWRALISVLWKNTEDKGCDPNNPNLWLEMLL